MLLMSSQRSFMPKKRKSYWSVSEIGPSPPPPLKVDADADAAEAADDGRVGIWKAPRPDGTAELKKCMNMVDRYIQRKPQIYHSNRHRQSPSFVNYNCRYTVIRFATVWSWAPTYSGQSHAYWLYLMRIFCFSSADGLRTDSYYRYINYSISLLIRLFRQICDINMFVNNIFLCFQH